MDVIFETENQNAIFIFQTKIHWKMSFVLVEYR
jgi:hypothetical protein